jgi:uncharacterized damage-inducible protein DinB
MSLGTRPAPDEFAPWYAPYIEGTERPLARLEAQPDALAAACLGLGEAAERARYAPGKWSVRQVVGHMVDTERVMAYRLLRVARADATPLPGFDEGAWAEAAGHDERPLSELVEEFRVVRGGTLALVRSLSPEAADRRGTASGHPVTGRSLVWILAGHVDHHLRILRDRYGVGA